MSHKFKVRFEWVHFLQDAMAMIEGDDWEEISRLARKLLNEAVREEFAEHGMTKFDIDGTDEKHIEITIDDPQKAMLFKLAHGGEA